MYRCQLLQPLATRRGLHVPAGQAVALKEIFSVIMGHGVGEFAAELRFLCREWW